MRLRAFSLIEGVVGLVISVLVVGTAMAVWRSSTTTLAATLGPQMDLQIATRKALAHEADREVLLYPEGTPHPGGAQGS